MWAPGSLSHPRELPVDVPDTLLQQAYPNKVIPKSLKSSTTTTTTTVAQPKIVVAQNAEPQSTPGRPLSASDVTLDFTQNEDDNSNIRTIIVEDFYGIGTLANPFEIIDEDLNGHKESSVDADEDYPFAKEDYPTMLKSCSDDSASPRSSSGRSDSTVPLDSSLVLRSSDLSKDASMASKVAQVFGTTSFDNPAYGLSDFQELRNIGITEQVTDLTMLIGQKVNGQVSSSSSDKKVSTGKKKKRPVSKVVDAEELLRIGSTDELLNIEMSSMPRIRKKKQHFSSGYSTLRSNASSADLDQVDFLVANKNFREVAVDCPADFVPVTKCHPVYPPPSKTPSQSNTLQRNENNNEVSIDVLPEKKVRSKIRTLLIDGIQSILPTAHPQALTCTAQPLDEFNKRSYTITTVLDPLANSPTNTFKSCDSLIDEEEDHGLPFPAYDNPCLDVSFATTHDLDTHVDCKFTTFLGDDEDIELQKQPARVENDDDRSQLIQEKNQNSRNSLRVRHTPRKEESPNTQNLNNSRLSMAYRNSKRYEIVKNLEASRFLCKSELDLSNASMFANCSKLNNSMSDTQLFSNTSTSEVIELIVIETKYDVEGEGSNVEEVDSSDRKNKVSGRGIGMRGFSKVFTFYINSAYYHCFYGAVSIGLTFQ